MVLTNPNGPEGFVTTFKDLGKFIAIDDEFGGGNLGVQTKLTEAVEQMDYDYGTVKSLSTFIGNMVSAVTNLDTAETNLVTSVTNYLTTVTAVDINTTTTTASGIVADLITQMQGASDDTAGSGISGILVLTSGHYDIFFVENYGTRFPFTSGTVLLTGVESQDLISGTLPGDARQIDDSYGD